MFGDDKVYPYAPYTATTFGKSLLPRQIGWIYAIVMIISIIHLGLWREFLLGMGIHTVHYGIRPSEAYNNGPSDAYITVGAGALAKGHWGYFLIPLLIILMTQYHVINGENAQKTDLTTKGMNSLANGTFAAISVAAGVSAGSFM